jgi:hypothetical protein
VGLYEVIGGARLKFVAMADHMDRLDQAVEGWLEDKAETAVAIIEGEANSQRTEYFFTVEDVIAYPSEEWGIILGDAVHCLRSALDQLAWGICDPDKRSNRTQFPICLSEKEWIVDAPAMYWGASDGFVKFFDRLQPYHRGDMNAAQEHPLAILRSLSNLDKHRTIPAIALVSDHTEATVVSTEGIAKWSALRFSEGTPYEKSAVIARAKIVPDESGLEPKMDVHVEIAPDIGFGVIGPAPTITHKPVYGVLKDVAEYTARILDSLVDAWNQAVVETHTEEDRIRARLEARRTYP